MHMSERCSYLRCEYYHPQAIGFCSRHHKEITSKKYYAGICWNCGTIHLISEIPKYIRESLTDKFLFTKQCFKCDPSRQSLDWITLNKTELPTIYVNDELMFIEAGPIKRNLYYFHKRSNNVRT